MKLNCVKFYFNFLTIRSKVALSLKLIKECNSQTTENNSEKFFLFYTKYLISF